MTIIVRSSLLKLNPITVICANSIKLWTNKNRQRSNAIKTLEHIFVLYILAQVLMFHHCL